ncbi:MAG: hypothetical protein KDN20_15245 [Verrucomicrobiae bacterium]|nr:hypothetical protein [Verrucomicrobiae bacterium]
MGTIFIMIVSTVGSGIGWWIGDFWGMAGALALSTAGSIIGFYYGWKWNRDLFCE